METFEWRYLSDRRTSLEAGGCPKVSQACGIQSSEEETSSLVEQNKA